MTLILRLLLCVISGLIIVLTATGIGFEWIGAWLIPKQKYLSNQIAARRS